jgi:hypothetical protein
MAQHCDRTITVQLKNLSNDTDLRLDDFLEQMAALKTALRETERVVAGGAEPSLYFTIKRLQKSSPANVTLEAVSDAGDERSEPRYASYVVRSLTANLRVIANKRRIPSKLDVPALEAYRALAEPAEKRLLEVKIQVGNNSVLIGKRFREILDSIMGDDEFSCGSVSGRLEAINLHDKNRRFQLFPTIGPDRIVGTFRNKDRKRFASAVDRYVTIYGRLRYKTWGSSHPYAINADDITIHDVQGGHTLEDLKGVSPGARGTQSTQEYIDTLRDEWQA